jgi:PEP-CTERM motif
MKKVAILMVGAFAGCTAMLSANASTGTDDLGAVKIGTTDHFAFESTKPPAAFTDSVNFDLKSAGAVVTDSFTASAVKGLEVALYDDTTHTFVFQCTSGCAAGTDSFSDLTKGSDYSLIISGKTTGLKGSSSSIFGTLSVAAAVPEPGTVTMLIAGLGLFGVIFWRRRSESLTSRNSGATLA